MSKRARPWKIADARSALKAQVASGLSVSAFAVRAGIDSDRLYRWRRLLAAKRERAAPSVPAVIELRVPPRRGEPVEILLASGVTLRVAETVDPSALARLVAALR